MSSPRFLFIRISMPLLFAGFALHVEILQVGVWTSMIRDYSQNSSLKLAVSDTFSGERPCEKCMHLTRSQTGTARSSEMTAAPSPAPDLEYLAPQMLPAPAPERTRIYLDGLLKVQILTLRPPTPPPRFFLS
ncbi:hypothetical protein P0Y35_14280 [Kiritimatiellaeota bacterium B1221]|nr:hypothetical protein [Kiritimatiellaeota bacterium B1221]